VDALAVLTAAGGSFAAGWLVGYALRRAMSIVLTAAGLFIAALLGLQAVGIVVINWGALAGAVSRLVEYVGGEVGPAALAVATSSVGLPFAAGVLLGLWRGGGQGPMMISDLYGEEDEL